MFNRRDLNLMREKVQKAYSPGARRLVTRTLFFNNFLVRRPVKSWSRWRAVWIFLYVWEIEVFQAPDQVSGDSQLLFSQSQPASG